MNQSPIEDKSSSDLSNNKISQKSFSANYVKLFLGGIPHNMTDDKIFEFLSKLVDIVSFTSEKYENKHGKTNKGYGYAFIRTMDEAKKLVEDETFEIHGRKIDVKYAATKEDSMLKMVEARKRKLYVNRLTKRTDEHMLKDYFAKYGPIEFAYVVVNLKTKKSRRFGFVMFREETSVEKVLEEKCHIINGKQIVVEKAVLKNDIKKRNNQMILESYNQY